MREVPGGGSAAQGNRNFLSLDNNGNVYFTGYTSGTTDWDETIHTSVEGFGNRDAFIIKYSPDGQVLMAKNFGADSYEHIDGIAVNAEGEIFAAGMVSGTGDFGGFDYEGEPWDYKPYIAKISGTTAGMPDHGSKSLTLYPNPVTDHFMITASGVMTGKVFNVLGQEVMGFSTTGELPVNVAQLPAGTYYVKADGFASVKLIKK